MKTTENAHRYAIDRNLAEDKSLAPEQNECKKVSRENGYKKLYPTVELEVKIRFFRFFFFNVVKHEEKSTPLFKKKKKN